MEWSEGLISCSLCFLRSALNLRPRACRGFPERLPEARKPYTVLCSLAHSRLYKIEQLSFPLDPLSRAVSAPQQTTAGHQSGSGQFCTDGLSPATVE